MYAVITSGGKQHRVAPGDTLLVDRIDAGLGTEVELAGLTLAVNDAGEVTSGDSLANSKVTATVKAHERGDKILVFKFKRKKQYKRTIGHRQNYTRLTIDQVVI